MAYSNSRARRLFGTHAGNSRLCHETVRGIGENGLPFCCQACPIREMARCGRAIEPVILQLGCDELRTWNLVMLVPLTAPDRTTPWLVHCAFDIDRAHKIGEYVQRLADRTSPGGGRPVSSCELTPREEQVLDMLARDQDPQAIAHDLGLSYATVRKHVQHVLTKLDAHTIEEAVARRLLEDKPNNASSPEDPGRGC